MPASLKAYCVSGDASRNKSKGCPTQMPSKGKIAASYGGDRAMAVLDGQRRKIAFVFEVCWRSASMASLMRRARCAEVKRIEQLFSSCPPRASGSRTGFVAPLLPFAPQASRRIRLKIYVFKGAIIGPNSR